MAAPCTMSSASASAINACALGAGACSVPTAPASGSWLCFSSCASGGAADPAVKHWGVELRPCPSPSSHSPCWMRYMAKTATRGTAGCSPISILAWRGCWAVAACRALPGQVPTGQGLQMRGRLLLGQARTALIVIGDLSWHRVERRAGPRGVFRGKHRVQGRGHRSSELPREVAPRQRLKDNASTFLRHHRLRTGRDLGSCGAWALAGQVATRQGLQDDRSPLLARDGTAATGRCGALLLLFHRQSLVRRRGVDPAVRGEHGSLAARASLVVPSAADTRP